MQDIEFTISRNKLYMLQTRNAKRTGFAAVRVAVDLVKEGLISKEEAISSRFIPPGDLNQLLQPVFEPAAKKTAIAEGQAAHQGHRRPAPAPRRASSASTRARPKPSSRPIRTAKIILVRKETTPEDIRGMKAAQGILTAVGGVSSHAALVSRQMGKVCIVGAGELNIDYKAGTVTRQGQGAQGRRRHLDRRLHGRSVCRRDQDARKRSLAGADQEEPASPKNAPVYQQFKQIMDWAEEYRKLRVRTNADLPEQADGRRGVRRRGNRPVPDRAHVLRPCRRDARDDHGR